MPRYEADCVLAARAEVGEGPVWDAASRRLLWVDITQSRLHAGDQILALPQPAGALALRKRGGLVLAVRDGFAFFDLSNGGFELVAAVEADRHDQRMNDGACDPAGRFWAGTMAFAGDRPCGSLYRLDGDLNVTRVLGGITVSNGVAWSPDARTMYYVDTATRRVDVLTYDLGSGHAGERRPFLTFGERDGLPDGIAVDRTGALWIAFYGAGEVRRYTPDGRLAGTVAVPVAAVTSCCFGGDGLRDLFITSAALGARRKGQAGAVFRARVDVEGELAVPFAG